jgi:hypothetical protein
MFSANQMRLTEMRQNISEIIKMIQFRLTHVSKDNAC